MTEPGIVGSVFVVCVSCLVAWRWWLEQRRFEVTTKDKTRDETLATVEPRLKALETRVHGVELAASWDKVGKR